MPMHTCVGSVPLCMWRPKADISCLSFSACSFETGPYSNLELVFSWLGLEPASPSNPLCPAYSWGYRCIQDAQLVSWVLVSEFQSFIYFHVISADVMGMTLVSLTLLIFSP